MSNKCVFATSDGLCSILTATYCTGFRLKKSCSFYKSKKEYIDELNRSIRINREKGNCIDCKYRSLQCEFLGTEEDQ